MMRKPAERQAVPKLFVNWSDEDFTWSWDSQPYTFRAGQSMVLFDYLADHFAGHLADREMDKLKIPTNHFTRQNYIDKAIKPIDVPDKPLVSEGPNAKLQQEILNKELEDAQGLKMNLNPEMVDEKKEREELQKENKIEPKKKLGRPKKVKEEVFEGMK